MYHYNKLVVLFLACFLAGCGDNAESQPKAVLAAMKELTEAFEKGDKELVTKAVKKMQTLTKESREFTRSPAENQRIAEKYQAQIQEQSKKLMEAMAKAVSSGKIKEAEMKEISTMMLPGK